MFGKTIKATVATAAACALATALAPATANAQRGSAGHLNILYWQAASTVNPYLSGGTKDIEAGSMVLDPLVHYDENGNMVPVLVEEIPTVENGGVASDLRSITYRIRKDIQWSDGTPLTAHDVVFSGEYCLHPDAGCNAASYFTDVTGFEALDDHTVKISFGVAKPFPYGPFVGSTSPIIQKAQFADCMGARAQECTEQNFGPIGTGPFKVDEFRANDVITFSANERYREADKPAFATATFKGGGDAASAARAVLETGEFDYAWNLQVEPEVLATDGRRRQGQGQHRLRHLGGAPDRQPDQRRPGPRAGRAFAPPRRCQSASLPLGSSGAPRPLARHRPPDPGRRGLRRSRPALLQHPARARGVPIDRQRRMPDAERGGGEPHPRRGRMDARRRRRPGEGRGAHSRSSTRPRPTPCARGRRR